MTRTWTSRQRVEAALNFEEPDRVPIDLTITLNAYRNLREYLGLPPEENIRADRFYEVEPALDVLEALGIDVTFVKLRGPRNWQAPPPTPDGIMFDEWGVGRRRVEVSPGVFLLEVVIPPLQIKTRRRSISTPTPGPIRTTRVARKGLPNTPAASTRTPTSR